MSVKERESVCCVCVYVFVYMCVLVCVCVLIASVYEGGDVLDNDSDLTLFFYIQ